SSSAGIFFSLCAFLNSCIHKYLSSSCHVLTNVSESSLTSTCSHPATYSRTFLNPASQVPALTLPLTYVSESSLPSILACSRLVIGISAASIPIL
ncbi:hypothetical protein DFH09DRAFT_1368622, partial [Mycena vulgaris]